MSRSCRLVAIVGVCLIVGASGITARAAESGPQGPAAKRQLSVADYARAERFIDPNFSKLIFKVGVEPNWIEESDRFWYKIDTRDGKVFVLVDPARSKRAPAFDHARLAAALSTARAELAAEEAAKEKPEPEEGEEQPKPSPPQPTAVDPAKLPFDTLEFSEDGDAIVFAVGDRGWTCGIVRYECSSEPGTPDASHELKSPDEKWALFTNENDLWVRPLGEGVPEPASGEGEEGDEADEKETDDGRIRLTDDGEPYYDYSAEPEGRTTAILEQRMGIKKPPSALWSPNSKKVLTARLDQREVGEFHLVQGVPTEGHRPVHYSYRMAIPGDENVPLAEMVIIDVPSGNRTAVDFEPLNAIYATPFAFKEVWWSEDGDRVYFVSHDRGDRRLRLVEADPATGSARVVIEERGATHLDLNVDMVSMFAIGPNVRLLNTRNEVIWFSQRDGWGHLYLYDLVDGALKNRITGGSWVVRDIVHVDEEAGTITFTAGGREEGRDPYLRQLYSVNLDGSGLRLLSSENSDHFVVASSSGSYLVDNYSTIDTVPMAVVRAADGSVVLELEEADFESLLATGWQWPERFRVKADDGVTDLYGVLFKPIGFDPEKSYPVLDDIYPGPQVSRVPKSYFPFAWGVGNAQAHAELGFVVFMVDGRGTSLRSKAFHDYSYRQMQQAGTLEDHIAAMRQVAVDHPYMDLDRVGIYGWSGGGFASVRAMLAHSDFYKVAVSGAGNHDQRSYVADWGEKYHGLPADTDYEAQANESLAANLEGKLLLVMPELDDNVHPTQTVQLIDALIKANRDFDLIFLPGEHHGPVATNNYFMRRRWDYFVRHLLDAEPPPNYVIKPSTP